MVEMNHKMDPDMQKKNEALKQTAVNA